MHWHAPKQGRCRATEYLLTTQNTVTHCNQRLAGCANVLLHGDDDQFGADGLEVSHSFGHFFIIFGVDTTKKQAFHSIIHLNLCSNQCMEAGAVMLNAFRIHPHCFCTAFVKQLLSFLQRKQEQCC